LFKAAGRYDYRGTYILTPASDSLHNDFDCQLVHKTGSLQAPARITAEMIDSYFRFNSGTKAFVQIAAQRVTITTDAIALKKEFLPAKKTITLDNK
jgi:hypothetical protein